MDCFTKDIQDINRFFCDDCHMPWAKDLIKGINWIPMHAKNKRGEPVEWDCIICDSCKIDRDLEDLISPHLSAQQELEEIKKKRLLLP